jgi:transcriptional regulator with XRE-family HTH domain
MDIEYLKRIKKQKKMTLQEISILSGVPKRTVDDIFSGKTLNPRIDTLQAIERALGIKEEIPPSERTEGEKDWMQLYYALTDENRDLLVKLVLAFKDMPPDRRRFVLDAIRLAIAQK